MSKKKHHERAKYRDLNIKNGSKDEGPDKIWDVVHQQSLDCFGLMIGCAAPNSLIRAEGVFAKMTEEQKASVEANFAKLAEATKRLKENLLAIREAHKDRRGSSRNIADLNNAVVINNQYLQWEQDWQTTVMPLIAEITDVIAANEGLQVSLNKSADDPSQVEVAVTEMSATIPDDVDIMSVDPKPADEAQFINQES